ncbi:hypothetical protein EVAR_42612_1 [Eumeta japonica]|uniref:Uncharacterized protein n=1 Tax=Eumeta variegata TaxID=151549 RepID=A0A4C1XLL3_EUMVA|nr:hypothetical protein EVAR_42612_1 [Eumeta japonica]
MLRGSEDIVASLLYQSVPNDWCKASYKGCTLVPLYKRKGSRQDVKCLLYADDQVIFAPLACRLQGMVNKMNDSVKKRVMKINIGKTKVMVFERDERTIECDILIEGEKVEQLKESKYTIVMIQLTENQNVFDSSLVMQVEKRVVQYSFRTEHLYWDRLIQRKIKPVLMSIAFSMYSAEDGRGSDVRQMDRNKNLEGSEPGPGTPITLKEGLFEPPSRFDSAVITTTVLARCILTDESAADRGAFCSSKDFLVFSKRH